MREPRFLLPLLSALYCVACPASEFVIRDASPDFAFCVAADCGEDDCEGPARTRVRRNATGQRQVLHAPDFPLLRDGPGELPFDATPLYEDPSAIAVDDCNFDGHVDLAIRNGNEGSYGGPSYDICVQGSRSGRFVPSPGLTELASTTLGMLEVDASRERVVTFEKSGCCYHRTTHYGAGRRSGVFVAFSLEGAVEPDGKHVAVTTRRLENGKLRTRTARHCSADQDSS